MADILQKHMKGNTQATIIAKAEPKEICYDETLRQGIYKYEDGVDHDILPSENNLNKIVSPTGGSIIGVSNSNFNILTKVNDQELWEEVDAFINGLPTLDFKVWEFVDQFIPTDNTELLNTDVNSYLNVTCALTSLDPADFTVGMKAGTVNGQIAFMQVQQEFDIEIDPNVAGSAAIQFHRDVDKLQIKGYAPSMFPGLSPTAMFRWNVDDNEWQQIQPTNAMTRLKDKFSGTFTGFTTAQVHDVQFEMSANQSMVTITLPFFTATSNDTTFTMTGVPDELKPAISNAQHFGIPIENNGTGEAGTGGVEVGFSSTWTFTRDLDSAGFNNAGAKGLPKFATFTYMLDDV